MPFKTSIIVLCDTISSIPPRDNCSFCYPRIDGKVDILIKRGDPFFTSKKFHIKGNIFSNTLESGIRDILSHGLDNSKVLEFIYFNVKL